MTDMIERVARALYEENPYAKPLIGEQWSWEYMIENKWKVPDIYRAQARAAIEALREPTPEIIEAMKGKIGPLAEMWRAGVDAALGDSGRKGAQLT